MTRHFRPFFAAILWTGLLTAQSQLGTGALSGAVTDPGGDPIADAAVTVVNTGTGLARRTSTSATGQFLVPVRLPALIRCAWKRRDSPPSSSQS